MDQWLKNNLDNQCPTKETINELAETTNLTSKQVYNWLSHARTKLKTNSPNTSALNASISIDQKILLKESFNINANPGKEEIQNLAQITSLSETRIKQWFVNTRKYNNKKLVRSKECDLTKAAGKLD